MSPNARIVFFTIAAQHALRACGGADGTFAVFCCTRTPPSPATLKIGMLGAALTLLGWARGLCHIGSPTSETLWHRMLVPKGFVMLGDGRRTFVVVLHVHRQNRGPHVRIFVFLLIMTVSRLVRVVSWIGSGVGVQVYTESFSACGASDRAPDALF